jgi:hypothetical protein
MKIEMRQGKKFSIHDNLLVSSQTGGAIEIDPISDIEVAYPDGSMLVSTIRRNGVFLQADAVYAVAIHD